MSALSDHAQERTVLGLALRDSGKAVELVNQLSHDDYEHTPHQRLHYLLAKRLTGGQPLDLDSIVEDVVRLGPKRFGGASYVADLADVPSTARTLEPIVKRIRECAMRRRLHEIALETSKAAQRQPASLGREPLPDDIGELTATVGQAVLSIGRTARQTRFTLGESARRAQDERDRLAENGGALAYSTGFPQLDAPLGGGLHVGNLVLIGGRPGFGKSALIQCMLGHIAYELGVGCAYLSLEMKDTRIADRFVAQFADVSFRVLVSNQLSDHAHEICEQWRESLTHCPLVLEVRPRITPDELAAWIRREVAMGAKVLAIDYLQLVKHDLASRNDLALIETARVLNELSIELGVVIIAASQMNREIKDRTPVWTPRRRSKDDDEPELPPDWWDTVPAPIAEDLKDGGIEAAADVILFPQHGDYYQLDPTLGVIRVRKNRNGPSPVNVPVRWAGPSMAYRP